MPVDNPSRRIRILRDDVSRKIAAGEVIDRPLSIVRELVDNAVDAGASSVDVYLEAGGLSRVRVVDDGTGMGPEDLALCWKPHATSKIETEDDLLTVTSLGFRGEALSSIAVASRLEIVSRSAAAPGGAEPAAHRLVVSGSAQSVLEACPGRQGTTVDVSELFFNYPARKRFLRSAASESLLCRSILVDRAVAHPSVAFRLFSDGELRLSLQPSGLLERVGAAYAAQLDARLLREAVEEGAGFSARVVAGLPDLRRRDRKLLQVFVNRRRVGEFSLIQAAEHAFAGYVPGGYHPVAFVFVDIDPGLVDFNIHPAKKEVRFRALPEVHAAVVRAGRKLLAVGMAAAAASGAGAAGRNTMQPGPSLGLAARPSLSPAQQPRSSASAPFELPRQEDAIPVTVNPAGVAPGDPLKYLGQVFGVFLVFELPGKLLLLDQHAAHEKLLFEALVARKPVPQEMLFPLSFDVSDEEDARLDRESGALAEMGIVVKRAGARTWEVAALGDDFLPLGEGDIVELLREAGKGGEEWRRELLARAACSLAIREGDPVDPVTARELCAKALALESPRCPHGRPIWQEISREDLFRAVDRPAGPATSGRRGASGPRP
jgi:DNA mismatch repair protein MutL